MISGMDGKEYNVQLVKDRLNAFREDEKEIENQTEALERLKEKMVGIGAQEITDLPRTPSPPSDRITDLIYRKIELENEIKEDIEAHAKDRKNILRILKKLKSADERAVIRFRYLLGMSWNDVTDAMFGAKEDYLDKVDSYQRRVYNIHGRALLSITIFVEDQAKQNR